MKYSYGRTGKRSRGESAAERAEASSGNRQGISGLMDSRQTSVRQANLQLLIDNSLRSVGQIISNPGPTGTIQCVLDNASHVVRGGLSAAATLRTNQGNDHRGYISANSADGQSIATLATTPTFFPNGQITVTTVGAIRALQNDAGQAMDVVEDVIPANAVHAGINPAHNPMTEAESERLSGVFAAQPNIWRH